MKTIHLLKISFFILCVMTLGSCSDDENDGENNVFQLTIASVHQNSFLGESYDLYFAKNNGEKNWNHYLGSINFSFTEGYEYVIKVRRQLHSYGPNENGIPYTDTLLEVISKVEKESEDIPVQNAIYLIASKSTGDEEMPYYARLKDGRWSKIPPIKGFEFEEGYETLVYFDCIYNGKDAPNPYTFIYTSSSQKEKWDTEGLPQ